MTVKDVVKLLRGAKRISIGFGDRGIHIEQNDSLMIDVYGDYVIDAITIVEDGECELSVAMKPIKRDSYDA